MFKSCWLLLTHIHQKISGLIWGFALFWCFLGVWRWRCPHLSCCIFSITFWKSLGNDTDHSNYADYTERYLYFSHNTTVATQCEVHIAKLNPREEDGFFAFRSVQLTWDVSVPTLPVAVVRLPSALPEFFRKQLQHRHEEKLTSLLYSFLKKF